MGAGSVFDVADHGAVGDGQADCTKAFQAALDAAGAAGGGIVEAGTGRYRFDGVLNFPKNVTLRGTYVYAPSHAGIRDNTDEKPVFGTVMEIYAGRGDASATPFITLNNNSVIQGVTVHYPEQDPKADAPTPYPWTIAMRGNNPAVIDVQLVNPYDAIDASHNQRALIRNVHGQPIHVGIYVDAIYDIGRIENVHWNPWWSHRTPVFDWQQKHGVGFLFEKTDWHYVHNTFCFGYNVGYKFAKSDRGGTNGNFLGIGADDCFTAVLVEQTEPMGVLITNGEFVSFRGPDPTMIRVTDTHTGTVRFSNCAFWGPGNRNALIDGHGTVGFSDCTFVHWGRGGGVNQPEMPSLDIKSGSVLVRGCEFMEDKPQVRLGENVSRAIITENLIAGKERIEKNTNGTVIIRDNAETPDGWRWEKQDHELPGHRGHVLHRDGK